MKRYVPAIGILLLFLAGTGMLLYPEVSNRLYERGTSRAVVEYSEAVEGLSPAVKEEQLRLAREYNAALTGAGIKDPFVPGSGVVLPDNYCSVLDIGGVMGYIEIPKISVYLPIRHGTGEETLKRSVGHIEATSFPIGGEGCHCVLTGHRGLAEAKLFTDLDKLEEGDIFLLHILGDTIAYQVDNVSVVEPVEVEQLRPAPGEDHVTLITCTPYAINSHRLLVRGSRVSYSMEEMPEEILLKMDERIVNWRDIAIASFTVLWAFFLFTYYVIEKKKRRP